ncbi:hemoglobin-binding protein, partial [Haemophilus influenzae 22.1-21]
GVRNPQGLHLEEKGGVYQIVDKDNKGFNYKDDNSGWSYGKELYNSKNEKISNDVDTEGGTLDSVLINCEKLNCDKKFRIYQEYDENYKEKYTHEDREIEVGRLPNGKNMGKLN